VKQTAWTELRILTPRFLSELQIEEPDKLSGVQVQRAACPLLTHSNLLTIAKQTAWTELRILTPRFLSELQIEEPDRLIGVQVQQAACHLLI
jgi:hypothetical protein